MRNRFLTLLAVCALAFSLSSCLENAEDILVSSESGLTQEELDNANAGYSKMAYGYLQGEHSPTAGETNNFSVVFTARDVATGNRLTGTSNMVFVNLVKQGDDLTGEYTVGGWEVSNDKGIASVNYCENMNFTTGGADRDEFISAGSIIITTNEEGGYNVSYKFNDDSAADNIEFQTSFPVMEP